MKRIARHRTLERVSVEVHSVLDLSSPNMECKLEFKIDFLKKTGGHNGACTCLRGYICRERDVP